MNSLGIFKGVLAVKHGIFKIQVTAALLKVGRSTCAIWAHITLQIGTLLQDPTSTDSTPVHRYPYLKIQTCMLGQIIQSTLAFIHSCLTNTWNWHQKNSINARSNSQKDDKVLRVPQPPSTAMRIPTSRPETLTTRSKSVTGHNA